MDKYIITDLYTAAFLRARGYECEIKIQSWRKCVFEFPVEAKDTVVNFIKENKIEEYNVNGLVLVNEIKQLKSYVNNL